MIQFSKQRQSERRVLHQIKTRQDIMIKDITTLLHGQQQILHGQQQILSLIHPNTQPIQIQHPNSSPQHSPSSPSKTSDFYIEEPSEMESYGIKLRKGLMEMGGQQQCQIWSIKQEEQDELYEQFMRVQKEGQNGSMNESGQIDVCIEQVGYGLSLVPSIADSSLVDVEQPRQLLRQLNQQFHKMKFSFNDYETLYQYPSMGDKSFMDSIVDKNNLILAMQLQSGQVVGAFTEISFSSTPVLIPRHNPRCFLFNLATHHYLYASKTNKTHCRDEKYITFGSWQIKLKVGELWFQSELGTRADCFRRRGYETKEMIDLTRQWLFGDDSQLKVFSILKLGIYTLK